MSLQPCPSCERLVSIQAMSCPQCRHPYKKPEVIGGIRLTDPVHLVGDLLCVLVVAGVAMNYLGYP